MAKECGFMNRIYKVVWSKVKHAYVVTSELAKSHTKSASGKAVKAMLATAVGIGFLMGGYTAGAVDNTPGAGDGVAIGTGSNAPKAENVAIGKEAVGLLLITMPVKGAVLPLGKMQK